MADSWPPWPFKLHHSIFCSPTWQSSQKLLQNWQCSADSAHLFLYPTNKIKYQIRKCWSRLEIDFCRYQTLNLHLTNSVIEWHRCFLGKLSFITCNKNNPNWNHVQTQIKKVCWMISPMKDPWYTLIWVNYNISPTWILRPFGDHFPY